jgi:hypothetical protein
MVAGQGTSYLIAPNQLFVVDGVDDDDYDKMN